MNTRKVLIADDSSSMRKFIAYAISNNFANVQTESVTNGKEAMAKLEKTKYDLILCDWQIPHMTGIELLEWLRKHPVLNATPFILITANNDKESVIKASRMGATAYIVKPLTMESLITKLTAVVSIFNRRQYERVAVSGDVLLQPNSDTCKGQLIDLSMGGVQGIFNRQESSPQVFDTVVVDLYVNTGVKNGLQIEGIDAFIVRIQAAEAVLTSEYLKIAAKFLDDIHDEKKRKLQECLSHMK